MGDQNILLPVEDVAELLGLDYTTISRYRRWCQDAGFLRQVQKANRHRRQAAEFRFDVGSCKLLEERSQRGTAEAYRTASGSAGTN